MITDGKPFDTNVFFSGGAGMFIQYHDIVKPVHLFAIYKMILTNQSFGLPIQILQHMSIFSLIEWYINRRYKNPLQCLDYNHVIEQQYLDTILREILLHDESIYKLAPALNIQKMFSVYHHHQMTFPVYIYSEDEEPFIREDCKRVFPGIPVHYFFGDLEECIRKCDQNFTYIFSDIELVKKVCEILTGTCSHVLLCRDYRYNFIDFGKTLKYDLLDIAQSHPFIRTGTTLAVSPNELALSFMSLNIQEEVD